MTVFRFADSYHRFFYIKQGLVEGDVAVLDVEHAREWALALLVWDLAVSMLIGQVNQYNSIYSKPHATGNEMEARNGRTTFITKFTKDRPPAVIFHEQLEEHAKQSGVYCHALTLGHTGVAVAA
jgi:hypothetical protein